MKVRTRRQAGAPDESDDIATLYALPFLDERFRQVTVDSFDPVTGSSLTIFPIFESNATVTTRPRAEPGLENFA